MERLGNKLLILIGITLALCGQFLVSTNIGVIVIGGTDRIIETIDAPQWIYMLRYFGFALTVISSMFFMREYGW